MNDRLIEKEKILSILKSNIKELQNIGKFPAKDIYQIVFESLSENIVIPISIFATDYPFESLCRYMQQKYFFNYSKISKLLNRDQRTIWYAINRKKKEKIIQSDSELNIPIFIFQNRQLSILENLVFYLKKSNYSNKEIADLLKKNPASIYSIISRINKKQKYEK